MLNKSSVFDAKFFDFWRPQPLKISISCIRNAHFHKIAVWPKTCWNASKIHSKSKKTPSTFYNKCISNSMQKRSHKFIRILMDFDLQIKGQIRSTSFKINARCALEPKWYQIGSPDAPRGLQEAFQKVFWIDFDTFGMDFEGIWMDGNGFWIDFEWFWMDRECIRVDSNAFGMDLSFDWIWILNGLELNLNGISMSI